MKKTYEIKIMESMENEVKTQFLKKHFGEHFGGTNGSLM